MSVEGDPFVTVVIPTIDRGRAIVETLQSVLQNDYPNFEVIIVDQSEVDGAELCLGPSAEGRPVRHFRVSRRGVAFSRNEGVRHARGLLVAFTDDDCTVPSTWLRTIVNAFQSDDRIGMVFGNVLAGPHSRERGFIQAYVRKTAFLAQGIRDKHHVEGTGACMAFRRSVWEDLGGFDQQLGAGGRFRSAEESDFAIRVLLRGPRVYETPEVSVVHHGFRTWAQRPRIIRDYLYGLGAMSAKHLKCGNWQVLRVILHLARRWAFAQPVVDLGERPPRILRLRAFVRGMAAGAVSPVDRNTGNYNTAPPGPPTVLRS